MLKLNLLVPDNNSYTGTLSGNDGTHKLECSASTQADAQLRIGDIPSGNYKFLKVAEVKPDGVAIYGTHIVFFQATSGTGARGSKPRILAIHGGKLGTDGKLLPTEGTVRISNDDLFALLQIITVNDQQVSLNVEQHTIRFYEKPFRTKVSTSRPRRVAGYTPRVSASSNWGRTTVIGMVDDDPIMDTLEQLYWYSLLFDDSSVNEAVTEEETSWDGFKGGESGGGGASDDWRLQVDETPPPVEQLVDQSALPVDNHEDIPRTDDPLFIDPYAPPAVAVEKRVEIGSADQTTNQEDESADTDVTNGETAY